MYVVDGWSGCFSWGTDGVLLNSASHESSDVLLRWDSRRLCKDRSALLDDDLLVVLLCVSAVGLAALVEVVVDVFDCLRDGNEAVHE
jgi:hypothetical protein